MKEKIFDVVKEILYAVAALVISYLYWFAMLMIASLVLVNVWQVTLVQILIYSGICMAVTVLIIEIRRFSSHMKKIK